MLEAGSVFRVVDAIRQSTIEERDARLEFQVEDDPRISDVEFDDLSIGEAQELGEDQMLSRVHGRGDVTLEIMVWRSAYLEAEISGAALGTFDPDNHLFDGEVVVSADITIDIVVRLDGTVEEAVIVDFDRLSREQELQRRLDGFAGRQLIEQVQGIFPLPDLSGYRPPEPIVSSVEAATLEESRPTGVITLRDILDRGPDGLRLGMGVEASGAVTWLGSAPDGRDLADFAGLAEGDDGGGGFLTDMATDEPLVFNVSAGLGADGWEEITVHEIRLRDEVLHERLFEAAKRDEPDLDQLTP